VKPLGLLRQIEAMEHRLQEGTIDEFGASNMALGKPRFDPQQLHAKIGRRTLKNAFSGCTLSKAGLLSAKR
jgi:hypothetical protein